MLARTHASVALLVSLILADHYQFSINFILTAVLFSALPDLDTPKSAVGKRIRPVSTIIKFLIGHRTFIHSIWPWAILFLLVYPFSKEVAFGIGVGYGTHLILDALTRSGVQPFHPIPYKVRGPLKNRGIVETLLFLGTLLTSVFYILVIVEEVF
jgi:inner membrane protein